MKARVIPAATEIAFVLDVLSLLGKKVTVSIKIFLTSLAISDERLSIIILGPIASGIVGYQILRTS